MKPFGVLVGRLSPMHLGHEALIRGMLAEHGAENCLLILGSTDAAPTERTPYSFGWRKKAVHSVFPELAIEKMPDFPTDEEWLGSVDELLRKHGQDPEVATFWGGCDDDLIWFKEAGRNVKILNRFDGTTPVVSATEVRRRLKSNDAIKTLVSPEVACLLIKTQSIVTR